MPRASPLATASAPGVALAATPSTASGRHPAAIPEIMAMPPQHVARESKPPRAASWPRGSGVAKHLSGQRAARRQCSRAGHRWPRCWPRPRAHGVAQPRCRARCCARADRRSRAQLLAFDDAALMRSPPRCFAPASNAARPASRWPTSPASASSGRCRWWSRRMCWCRARKPNCWSNAAWRGSMPTRVLVADLGTGSLAIAAALALERPDWQHRGHGRVGRGTRRGRDQSPASAALADIELREGSWCAGAAGDEPLRRHREQPPVCRAGRSGTACPGPRTAGCAGRRRAGLCRPARHRRCARAAPASPGGVLLLEHGATQAPAAAAELVALGYARVVCHRDLAGLDRVTKHLVATLLKGHTWSVSKLRSAVSPSNWMPQKAPLSAENFLAYVDDGFFDGLIFHRVIPGFMIQGGGHAAGHEPEEEQARRSSNEATNGLKNRRGTLAMARTNDIHSATSQFFINLSRQRVPRQLAGQLRLCRVRPGRRRHGHHRPHREGTHRAAQGP